LKTIQPENTNLGMQLGNKTWKYKLKK